MVLAIDTASETASAAIVEGTEIIAEFSVKSVKTHSKAVLPMIGELFSRSDKKLIDIDYVACCAGPGSFTGLRIGAAVAKGLAFAHNKKIVPVSSLDALAYNVLIEGYTICPMIDARGGHVYTALYKNECGRLSLPTDYLTIPVADALDSALKYGLPVCFTGSGAKKYREKLDGVNTVIAPEHLIMHRAGVLGVYACKYSDSLKQVSGGEFAPLYMSRAQAAGADE